MKVLVTGSAGFIGSALSIRLLDRGDTVVGIDNHNDYYDPALKESRLARHADHSNYTHIRMNLEDREAMTKLFEDHQFEGVVNLAAQAGVRYSIENPLAYIDTNLVGFAHILEGCRHNKVGHLVYASSSSTYGLNTKQPFSTHEAVNHPVSLYAATKKANELMAHTYSHLYDLPTTGLRFFTVYGPYDRPDMALQKFTRAIMNDEPITVFNYGKHRRDFTYIDDIVNGLLRTLDNPPLLQASEYTNATAPHRLYNIGNNNPVSLRRFIGAIEKACGKKAQENLLPMKPGDVPITYADVDPLIADYGFQPSTTIEDGIQQFVEWFIKHNSLGNIQ